MPVPACYGPRAVHDQLKALLRDATLVRLALAIALGWSLFQVAKGVADVVSGLLTSYPSATDYRVAVRGQPLTWIVGDRVLSFWTLLIGVIEFAVVVGAALLARAKAATDAPS
jgi:hypothetical protein